MGAQNGPAAPDGDWYKHFGSFILCGSGKFPIKYVKDHRRRRVRAGNFDCGC